MCYVLVPIAFIAGDTSVVSCALCLLLASIRECGVVDTEAVVHVLSPAADSYVAVLKWAELNRTVTPENPVLIKLWLPLLLSPQPTMTSLPQLCRFAYSRGPLNRTVSCMCSFWSGLFP